MSAALDETIRLHGLWLRAEKGGVRMDPANSDSWFQKSVIRSLDIDDVTVGWCLKNEEIRTAEVEVGTFGMVDILSSLSADQLEDLTISAQAFLEEEKGRTKWEHEEAA